MLTLLNRLYEALGGEDINRSAKAIIRDEDGRVLVLKDAGTDWWDFPGGHLEQGERAADALAREVSEECGLELTTSAPMFSERLQLGDDLRPVHFYTATAEGEVAISDEHEDHGWFTPDEIAELDMGAFGALLDRLLEPCCDSCEEGGECESDGLVEHDKPKYYTAETIAQAAYGEPDG